jgi:hypothetical protein
MSEYAKQCSQYQNVYHVKPYPDCANCINSEKNAWNDCSIPELKWKQQRFKISQEQNQTKLSLHTTNPAENKPKPIQENNSK